MIEPEQPLRRSTERRNLCVALVTLSCTAQPPSELPAESEALSPTHGALCTASDDGSLTVWARADRDAVLNVVLDAERFERHASTRVGLGDDYTGTVRFEGLEAGKAYAYRAWFTLGPARTRTPPAAVSGKCSTPPAASEAAEVRFAFGGDLGGQRVCRDARDGYRVFQALSKEPLSFFLGLGDLIYADNECPDRGRYGNAQVPGNFARAASLDQYWAHYKYNRADPLFERVLGTTTSYAIWDDHEVVNDFGPQTDVRNESPYVPGAHLMPIGLRAFLDYHPTPGDDDRLYQAIRWGKHLKLILLDTRRYRERLDADDEAPSSRSLLGAAQKRWLLSELRAERATWTVIVSSVPISVPTGSDSTGNRDGWASFDDRMGGYELELLELFTELEALGIRRSLFLSTDVHFATGFRYRPFVEHPDFEVYELISGPLSAGLFPRLTVDPTFRPERLFYYGAADPGSIESYDEAVRWMNYGTVHIDATGTLTLGIVNALGERVFQMRLPPA